MCQVTDTREYLILGREKAQQVYKGYFAWSCIPRGVPGLCERCPISQKHRCPATKLTFAYCSAVILNGNRHCLPITKEYLLFEYKDVFEGIGKLPGGPYRIQLKCDVPASTTPTQSSTRKEEAYLRRRTRKLRTRKRSRSLISKWCTRPAAGIAMFFFTEKTKRRLHDRKRN